MAGDEWGWERDTFTEGRGRLTSVDAENKPPLATALSVRCTNRSAPVTKKQGILRLSYRQFSSRLSAPTSGWDSCCTDCELLAFFHLLVQSTIDFHLSHLPLNFSPTVSFCLAGSGGEYCSLITVCYVSHSGLNVCSAAVWESTGGLHQVFLCLPHQGIFSQLTDIDGASPRTPQPLNVSTFCDFIWG